VETCICMQEDTVLGRETQRREWTGEDQEKEKRWDSRRGVRAAGRESSAEREEQCRWVVACLQPYACMQQESVGSVLTGKDGAAAGMCRGVGLAVRS
jgi:hypothetical protein